MRERPVYDVERQGWWPCGEDGGRSRCLKICLLHSVGGNSGGLVQEGQIRSVGLYVLHAGTDIRGSMLCSLAVSGVVRVLVFNSVSMAYRRSGVGLELRMRGWHVKMVRIQEWRHF